MPGPIKIPARTRSFGRIMPRAEFEKRFGQELQLVQKLKAQGKDTSKAEAELAKLRTLQARGQAIPQLDIDAMLPPVPRNRPR